MKTRLATFCLTPLVALALQSPAQATAYCSGSVSNTLLMASGEVMLNSSWRQDSTQICNIREAWNGISTDTCVAWLAKIDAAVSLNKTLLIYYSSASDCATLATYGNSPAPGYVMLLNS